MAVVLVADDSDVVRLALVRRFKSAGFVVVEAASVAAAKAIDASTLDAAVLDFDLGDGYGNEIAEHLVATKPGLPMCFFTSSTAEAQEKAGGYGQIYTKPDQVDAVFSFVSASCGGG